MSGSQKRVAHLDRLRGVALILVLLYHSPLVLSSEAYPWTYSFLHFFRYFGWKGTGWSGLAIFFILSGFLLTQLLVKEFRLHNDIQIGRFFLRRIFRIWPSLYFFLGVYVLFQCSVENRPFAEVFNNIWANFFHLQNYFRPEEELAWLWSLSVEEHFYFGLPLILVTLLRRKKITYLYCWLGAFVAFVLCLGLRLLTLSLSNPSMEDLLTPTHLCLETLFLGSTLALVHELYPDRFTALLERKTLLLVILFGSYAAVQALGSQPNTWPWQIGLEGMGCGALFLLSFAYARDPLFPNTSLVSRLCQPAFRLFEWFGKISYSVYLWHYFFGYLIVDQLAEYYPVINPQTNLSAHLLYLGVPILLGMTIFHAIERPLLRVRDSWLASPILVAKSAKLTNPA